MQGVGAARTRDTYLAVLRPWFGFLTGHGYEWNARPEAVREYTRLFLIEAGCALQRGRVDGRFIQATNRSPISSNGLHLLIAALRSFYSVMRQGVSTVRTNSSMLSTRTRTRCTRRCYWRGGLNTGIGFATRVLQITPGFGPSLERTQRVNRLVSSRSNGSRWSHP
jgi:hypothetical protein